MWPRWRRQLEDGRPEMFLYRDWRQLRKMELIKVKLNSYFSWKSCSPFDFPYFPFVIKYLTFFLRTLIPHFSNVGIFHRFTFYNWSLQFTVYSLQFTVNCKLQQRFLSTQWNQST